MLTTCGGGHRIKTLQVAHCVTSSKSAPWCSGLTCHPVTVEIAGSNPVGVANMNIHHDAQRGGFADSPARSQPPNSTAKASWTVPLVDMSTTESGDSVHLEIWKSIWESRLVLTEKIGEPEAKWKVLDAQVKMLGRSCSSSRP